MDPDVLVNMICKEARKRESLQLLALLQMAPKPASTACIAKNMICKEARKRESLQLLALLQMAPKPASSAYYPFPSTCVLRGALHLNVTTLITEPLDCLTLVLGPSFTTAGNCDDFPVHAATTYSPVVKASVIWREETAPFGNESLLVNAAKLETIGYL